MLASTHREAHQEKEAVADHEHEGIVEVFCWPFIKTFQFYFGRFDSTKA
jgi:hypothetical protein